MSEVGVTISIPTGQIGAVNKLLDGYKWLASDLSKPFKRFGVYYGAVVMRTFKEGGRPPGSWKPLAPYTLAMRKWRGKRTDPKRILQDAGILRMSFASEIQPQGMKYGTSVPYAQIHQMGGLVTRKARTIRAKAAGYRTPDYTMNEKAFMFSQGGKKRGARALRFLMNGEIVYRTSVYQPERTFKVPARPMITWLPEDEAKLEEIVAADFEKRGGFWYGRLNR